MKKVIIPIMLVVILVFSSLAAIPHGMKNDEKAPGFTFDHYPSYEEMNHTIHEMQPYYSSIMKVFSIGKTWGWNKVSGKYDSPREIWTIKISDNVEQDERDKEPGIMINWHHAREWIDPVFNLYLIQHLLEEYNTNDTIHWLVDHYEIYIIPMTNADGYVQDGNGNLSNLSGGWGPGGWRKNCRDNNGDGTLEVQDQWSATGEGVDPERNWDWDWSDGDSDPNSSTYHGPYPFSEPEMQAERDFIINYSIDSYAVMHSFHGSILIPWFYTSSHSPHDPFYRAFARNMSLLTKIEGDPTQHYDYGQPSDVIGYTASGGSSDWVYGKYNKIGIAVEMEPQNAGWSDGFHPSTDKIQTYCDDLYEAMVYFIEISDSKLKPQSDTSDQPNPYVVWGHVTDSSGNPLSGMNVEIKNEQTGEIINTTSDENGFYMLNLATMSHKYTSGTTFRISCGDYNSTFNPTGNGRRKIDIVTTQVPEFVDYSIGIFVIIALMAVIRKSYE